MAKKQISNRRSISEIIKERNRETLCSHKAAEESTTNDSIKESKLTNYNFLLSFINF